MATTQTDEPARRKPFRLWPGVCLAVLQLLVWIVLPILAPGTGLIAGMGGLFGGFAIVVWWAFFSRAPLSERWAAVALMIVALYAASRFLHESIAGGGMGMLFYVYAIPVLGLLLVAWAVFGHRFADLPRRVTLGATILLACGVWLLLRTNGTIGNGSDFAWRWTETPEERLLAQGGDEPMAPPPVPGVAETEADWPGFRGPGRDDRVRGVRIETDWSVSPPVELWRRSIGPGWSSFAVRGDLLYTQEQRGDDEVVACYRVADGEPVWRHHDATRFWESNAGAGPRATPAFGEGRVYTFGATGILNALDAEDGAVAWSRDVATDTGVKVPYWGFSGSPLVVDDVVIVAVAAQLVAYDLASGEPRWSGAAGGMSYSSPHRLTIDGVTQVLFLNGAGATSVAPGDGSQLWEHPWPGAGIVQPALTAGGDILISGNGISGGTGMCRIGVERGPEGWTIEERWTSTGLKPYFSDFVVHEGHAFGFDGSILACIDLEDGKRKWKGGRYGSGQLLLLVDQDVLIVMSERGELALVAAAPDRFTELARFPAIEGKTWNHPVLVGDVLLVRNDQEMAAFRLALAD